jgi:hypothetical protein
MSSCRKSVLLCCLSLTFGEACARAPQDRPKPPGTQKGPASVDLSSPKGALKSLHAAVRRGDAAAITASIHSPDPAREKLHRAFAESVATRVKLREAVAAKFGRELLTPDSDQPTEQEIDAAPESIKGDVARVEVANGDLVRVKGSWKVALFNSAPKGVAEETLPALDGYTAEMRQATNDVRQGRVKTAEEARQLLQKYPMPLTRAEVRVGGGVEQGSGSGQK